jgi:peptidoglycan/LPS O-acetylase OafA/YrhL
MKKIPYIRQLDSIRAIAVILVIISHWIRHDHWINFTPNGLIGVDLFFILSGFLITRILLTNRLESGLVGSGQFSVIFNFYGRRMLRIFPIYYITIFILLIFHDFFGTHIQNGFIYFLTYTSNYYFFKMQNWDIVVSHLWSLSVEEQFYIMWPLLMLFVPWKYIQKVIFFFIICGVMSQFVFRATQFGDILTSSCFDAFGLGALLAWQVIVKPVPIAKFYRIVSWAVLPALLVLVSIALDRNYYFMFGRLAIRIIGLWFITYTVYREPEINISRRHLLNNKWLMRFGKISYGIYLYHLIIPTLLLKLSDKFWPALIPFYQKGGVYFVILLIVQFVVLIIVSVISWRFIEKPFLNMKKYFSYGESEKPKLT